MTKKKPQTQTQTQTQNKIVVIDGMVKGAVVFRDISTAQMPTSNDLIQGAKAMDNFATAALAGKPMPEGLLTKSKSGTGWKVPGITCRVTVGKIKTVADCKPADRLLAWEHYQASAKNKVKVSLHGLQKAIKMYKRDGEEGGTDAPLPFKDRVISLVNTYASDPAALLAHLLQMKELESVKETVEAAKPEPTPPTTTIAAKPKRRSTAKSTPV